jgi:hypothetical protein
MCGFATQLRHVSSIGHLPFGRLWYEKSEVQKQRLVDWKYCVRNAPMTRSIRDLLLISKPVEFEEVRTVRLALPLRSDQDVRKENPGSGILPSLGHF